MFKKIGLALGLLLALASPAAAQSGCKYIVNGAVLTASQWNWCLQQKNDTLGYTPVNKAGDTMGGTLTMATLSTRAGLNLPQVSAPSLPSNGDVWMTASGLQFKANGTVISPFNTPTFTGGSAPPSPSLYSFWNNTAGATIPYSIYDGAQWVNIGTLNPSTHVWSPSGGIASGTSGGIPYFSSATTLSSSALLGAGNIVLGGGAGTAPYSTSTAAGIVTWLGTPSSANLRTALTDETGTGVAVFAGSPTFTGTITAAAANFSGAVSVADIVRATGASTPASGTGAELGWSGTTSYLSSVDRAGAVWKPLTFYASTYSFAPSGGAATASITSTGINSTNIGATTPGTLAATTGSFSGVVTLTSNNGEPLRLNGATTGTNVMSLTNTGGSAYFGQENSAGGNIIVGSTAYDTVVRGTSGIAFSANSGSAMQMRLSSAGLAVNGTHTITSASASALAVGRQGATYPALSVDASVASSATGLRVTAAAAGGGVNADVISSGTNENLSINAKGSGTIAIGNVSTGAITLSRATTVSGNLTTNITGTTQCVTADSSGVLSGTGVPCPAGGPLGLTRSITFAKTTPVTVFTITVPQSGSGTCEIKESMTVTPVAGYTTEYHTWSIAFGNQAGSTWSAVTNQYSGNSSFNAGTLSINNVVTTSSAGTNPLVLSVIFATTVTGTSAASVTDTPGQYSVNCWGAGGLSLTAVL